LTGAPQTTLATLYAKALDADFEAPILGDRYAKDLVERIDYDWRKTAVTARNSPSVTSRSARFDSWVRQFLAVTPQAVVLDLGCGLDSRFFRVEPGPGVDWYDVDYPEIAELRKQLLPTGDHYHVVAASVSDPTWLRDIPADRPALMVAEGLTMYLTEQDGIALLRRVVDRFPSGELQFDACNRLGIKWQWMNTPPCGGRDRGCPGASTGRRRFCERCPVSGCWRGSGGSSRTPPAISRVAIRRCAGSCRLCRPWPTCPSTTATHSGRPDPKGMFLAERRYTFNPRLRRCQP
jgi:hypothetical protein